MNRANISDKIAKMLVQSRTIAGKSQDYMAKALGVSRTSIQKWEDGSVPIQVIRVFEWFNAIDVPSMPFVWGLIHDSLEDINADIDENKAEEALIDAIKGMSHSSKLKLLFLMYGDHGSDSAALLELGVAYEQLALREKLDVANLIRLDYHIAKERNEIEKDERVQPDMKLLDMALQAAYKSVTQSKNSYTISGSTDEH